MFNLENTPYLLDQEAEKQLTEKLRHLEERITLLRRNGALTDETVRNYYGEKRFEQARQDFSRQLKWIRPILAAKNDLAIIAYGGPGRPASLGTYPTRGRHHRSRNDSTRCRKACIFTPLRLRENTCTIASGD